MKIAEICRYVNSIHLYELYLKSKVIGSMVFLGLFYKGKISTVAIVEESLFIVINGCIYYH